MLATNAGVNLENTDETPSDGLVLWLCEFDQSEMSHG